MSSFRFDPLLTSTAVVVGALALLFPAREEALAKPSKACPAGMARIADRYCIDKYEASTVEVLAGNKARPHSPYDPVDGIVVRAQSKRGAIPQAYISRDQADAACKNAGKRLCSDDEWLGACRGKHPSRFPYGDLRKDGYCNDAGVSSFNRYYGPGNGDPPGQEAYTWANMNDPRLNQLKGTVAPSGSFKKCRSSFDVYDLVGNLHEWTASKTGTFRGGYYLDTHINGDGCDYRTTAHAPSYHDYSTGFRCCK